jgi:hypothetical protein
MSATHITHIGTSADPIEYLLTRKGEHAAGTAPSRWDCTDHGPLTTAEALDVLRTHGGCGPECRISRTARKIRARLIDAPTVRASVARVSTFYTPEVRARLIDASTVRTLKAVK